MKILGIDICKGSCVAYLLDTDIVTAVEPRQLLYKAEFHYCKANVLGLKQMLDLNPDVAVLEPTGVNYSRLWSTYLARKGIPVALVAHNKLARYRESLDMPDKSDESDSFALAYYYKDFGEQPRRFVQQRDPELALIRQKVLRLCHLARCQNPIINRVRQDLAWQFPEVAMSKSKILFEWLAEDVESKKFDLLFSTSCGLGIEENVRLHAKRLTSIWKEERSIEAELCGLMTAARFDKYREVFARWGFGERTQAIILSQIFPIENFLTDENKPIVSHGKSRRNKDKRIKRHISLRRFTKALGCAPSEKSSGDKKSASIVGGSDLCRRAIWLWSFTRIEVRKNRVQNDIGETLGNKLDEMKQAGRSIKLARMHIVCKAVKMLFYELVDKSVTTET
jgi:hypothetical protein